jgi:hypothetical protein
LSINTVYWRENFVSSTLVFAHFAFATKNYSGKSKVARFRVARAKRAKTRVEETKISLYQQLQNYELEYGLTSMSPRIRIRK